VNVLAIDPGMAVGMASWRDGEFESWECRPNELLEHVWGAGEARTYDSYVMEDFHLGGGRPKTTQGTRVTVELIGAVRFICHYHGAALHMQWPEDAQWSDNDKLKRAGFVTPSKPDHRRSAARHLLLHLVETGVVDPLSVIP
jgi:hypothetical protein